MRTAVTAMLLVASLLGAGEPPPPFSGDSVETPTLFAPHSISSGDYELNAAFSRDMRTVFFCRSGPLFPFPNTFTTILQSSWNGSSWAEPEVAPFSGVYSDIDPYFSPDFARLFYMSNRPHPPGDSSRRPAREPGLEPADFDLWFVDRETGGWSEPQHTGKALNSDAMEGYPAVAADGTLYFFSTRPGGYGPADIYAAEPDGATWGAAVNLGPAINSAGAETNVYVAPDERYLIFSSSRMNPADPFADLDLYVSFRRGGEWSPAESLGELVNTPGWEFTPMVSPDGRFLFFARATPPADDRHRTGPVSYGELTRILRGPGNGLGDIFYVELAALRPEWGP